MENVHPELLEQLAKAGTGLVQAIVQLRPPRDLKRAPTPDGSQELADRVLNRVGKSVGHPAVRTNVLRNVSTVVVEADPEFVRALIQQPEVVSALPNVTSQSMLIPPKRKRPV
jgi:hypothetical protein